VRVDIKKPQTQKKKNYACVDTVQKRNGALVHINFLTQMLKKKN